MFKTVQTYLKPTQHKKNKNLPTKPLTSEKKKEKKIVTVTHELEHRTSLDLKTSAFPLDQYVLAVNKDNFF